MHNIIKAANYWDNKNAYPVSGISSGSKKDRILLKLDDKISSLSNLINIHFKTIYAFNKPTLSFKEKFRWMIVKAETSNGKEIWIKVNKESLRKRLGMSKAELSEYKKNIDIGTEASYKAADNMLHAKIKNTVEAQKNITDNLDALKKELSEVSLITGRPIYKIKAAIDLRIKAFKNIKNIHPSSQKILDQFFKKMEKAKKEIDKQAVNDKLKAAALITSINKLIENCKKELTEMDTSV